ncbi:peptidyl-prolyl cis-trans isomerase D [Paraperlucidibaca baekdonensis]|uniref:Periplasmic chaperone PpiD n=1 Tax=Paraperlucidibaca baekdonensis TaxID=748120 RepID=A0A3E0H2F7_9GAMM|nr:SurA N-terminal domain-containing protein [Paraperlucidibaca baekdonensis]REH36971.1 peptidyl-prolyl cis-trans isomerase D [Paraperlucidibaca baekdonensis]
MDAFRDMVRGWLGKFLLALLSIPFIFFGVETYFGGGAEPTVAEVDGEPITQRLLDRAVNNQRQQLMARMGPDAILSAQQQAELRETVLNSLVQRQLLLKSARDAGYSVSEVSVQQLIRETPTFQDNGQFSAQRYVQVLSQIGETPTTFPLRAREEILISQQVSGWLQSSFVTGAELDTLTRLDTQTRNVRYAEIPASRYAKDVEVSDTDIAQAYANAGLRFQQPERVAVNYITLDRASFLANAKASPEAVKARYDQRVAAVSGAEQRQASHILIAIDDSTDDAAAKQQIDTLAAELSAGADFAALAEKHSKDPGSATQGGDLGFASKGMFVPEFEDALFALAKPGDVSPVVKTPFGYHLIKLTAVRKETPPSFASLESTLINEVRQAQADDAYNKAVESLDANVYEAADLIEPAKIAGLSIAQSPIFDRRGADGVLSERKVIEAAFNEEQSKERRNSAAITLKDGRTVWLHVTQHIAARKQPLPEVAAQLREEVRVEKALKQAMEQAQAWVKRSANEPESAWLPAANVRVQTASALSRSSKQPEAALLAAIFRAPVPVDGALRWSAFALPDRVALVQVTSVSAKPALAGPERQVTQGLLAQNQGQQELQDALAVLRSDTDVTIKALNRAP